MTTQEQIEKFHQFALQQITGDADERPINELFELWQLHNPTRSEQHEIYQALDRSRADIEAGRIRPADESLKEIRAKLNLPE